MSNMRDTQGLQICQQPQVLLQSLMGYIRQEMASYEKSFPAGQSPHVQLCLYQIEVYLAFIETLRVENVEQGKNLYFALCGMLWSVLARVDKPQDQTLAQSIRCMLREHDMHKQNSLDEYNLFCTHYRHQLPPVTPSIVSYHLSKRFDEVRKQLEGELYRDRYRHTFALADLKAKARGVITEVVCYKFECESMKKPFDYKLYSSIFATTKQLMLNPGNDALKVDYEYLMSLNKQGASSSKQMIAGVMLAFAGAVTVAATCIGEAVSACTSAAVTFPVKALGFATIMLGVMMFGAGRSYGTTSAMKDFRQEIDQCNRRQAASIEGQRGRDERLPLLVGMRR